jgi:disease resistance protein RPM1
MEFATGALGLLLPKLGQLLRDEYNLLRDVGEVPPEQLSEVVKVWARDAREVSYDMEDIVDTFLVRVQGTDSPISKKSRKMFVKEMMGFVTKTKIRHDIGRDIKDIKERVKEIAARRDR